MTRVGVTGHQHLPREALRYITEGARAVLAQCAPPVRAVTSLAAGADQLVAREALRLGGTLHVIVPADRYETTFSQDDESSYWSLLGKAEEVTRLEFSSPSEEAFWAAGKAVVDGCDLLIAIWDGKPARGFGGTGEVVAYAHELRKDVRIIWPVGAVRS